MLALSEITSCLRVGFPTQPVGHVMVYEIKSGKSLDTLKIAMGLSQK